MAIENVSRKGNARVPMIYSERRTELAYKRRTIKERMGKERGARIIGMKDK